MTAMPRRDFLKTSALAAALAATSSVAYGVRPARDNDLKRIKNKVYLYGDGLALTPQEYAHLLDDLADDDAIAPDKYSRGGVVEELEQKFARMLGKEAAVFMPTGTLANHLAVRSLCGERRKVIVPAESHIYNDAGDCAQTLSGLNLVPLAPGKATFTLAEVQDAVNRARAGRVKAEVGAILLESPVRRQHNAVFRWDEMQRVAAYAREEGIGLHLDGARLPVVAVQSGRPMSEYAALFDTVYVSLYKCYSAASGAILAGPAKLLEGMYQERRRFGGGMPYVWPFAAVALHYADRFAEEYAEALEVADEVFTQLTESGKFKVERVTDGTSIVLLHLLEGDPQAMREKLIDQNVIMVPPTDDGVFTVKINPTWNRTNAKNLAKTILKAV